MFEIFNEHGHDYFTSVKERSMITGKHFSDVLLRVDYSKNAYRRFMNKRTKFKSVFER